MNIVIDGGTQLNRCFWSAHRRPLNKKDGTFVGDIYLFLKSIIGLKKMFNPEQIYIAWDKKLHPSVDNFRKALSMLTYKENRATLSVDVYQNEMKIMELMEYFGCRNMFPPYSMEADDVVCWIVKHIPAKWIIVSTDQDFYQLVNENVSVYSPIKKVMVDLHDFNKITGVDPCDYILYKCIVGDISDNICGVQGYGPVKAKKLIQEFKNDFNSVNLEISNKIEFNRKLVDLEYAMNVVASYEALQSYQEQFQRNENVVFNKDRFLKKCEEFEFESIIKQYSV